MWRLVLDTSVFTAGLRSQHGASVVENAADFFRQRAGAAKAEALKAIFGRAPDVPPMPRDEIDPRDPPRDQTDNAIPPVPRLSEA